MQIFVKRTITEQAQRQMTEHQIGAMDVELLGFRFKAQTKHNAVVSLVKAFYYAFHCMVDIKLVDLLKILTVH